VERNAWNYDAFKTQKSELLISDKDKRKSKNVKCNKRGSLCFEMLFDSKAFLSQVVEEQWFDSELSQYVPTCNKGLQLTRGEFNANLG
jgi:hypothetical protein